jgi:hypothetical protein
MKALILGHGVTRCRLDLPTVQLFAPVFSTNGPWGPDFSPDHLVVVDRLLQRRRDEYPPRAILWAPEPAPEGFRPLPFYDCDKTFASLLAMRLAVRLGAAELTLLGFDFRSGVAYGGTSWERGYSDQNVSDQLRLLRQLVAEEPAIRFRRLLGAASLPLAETAMADLMNYSERRLP